MMVNKEDSTLPQATNEDQRVAAGHFEYANRAAVLGDHDIAIQFLRTSCMLVPANLSYRQALRKVEKLKYRGNPRGSLFAPLIALVNRLRLWSARREGNHRKVLEHGEAILARDPWDKAAQLHMAEAAVEMGLPVLALWILQEGREQDSEDVSFNRALARLLEQEGHLSQAIVLWQKVHQAVPWDVEAQGKADSLAASETINRGNYETATIEPAAARAPRKPTPDPVPEPNDQTPVQKRFLQEEAAHRARLDADPSNPDPYLQLASLYNRQGRLEDAEAILKQGLRETREAAAVAVALADLEIVPYRRALEQIEEKLQRKPGDERLLKKQRKLREEINTRELASFRRKVEQDPTDKANRFELGMRLLAAGEVEAAIVELQTARSDGRLYWRAVMHLGHCFAARNNWTLALRNFEDALSVIPEGQDTARKELLLALARTHAAQGDLARAIERGLDLANLDYAFGNIGRLVEEWQGKVRSGPGKAAGK
jgi:tetratricopeptide (TPR) repeat protein